MGSENSKSMRVRLEIDGKVVPIKKIIQDMIGGAVIGLVKPLKGVDTPERIIIEVEPN